ncbi:hypothetical protein MMC22_011289, partial [Lobaria immixta]|nr:hypothetical protein [Lobaria immixta]
MRSSIFTSLAILATSLCFASTGRSLGINCRGSTLCRWSKLGNHQIIPTLLDAVVSSGTDDATVYNSGDHVICHNSKICLFPQEATLTLGQIKPLIQAILDHNCMTCGSVPIHFVDQGSNDPRWGILTFNHVRDPRCDGNCIQSLDPKQA